MDEKKTNISEWHKETLQAIREASNIVLVSCFVNGEPAAAIATVNEDGDMVVVTPFFVSITPSMKIVDHDGIQC